MLYSFLFLISSFLGSGYPSLKVEPQKRLKIAIPEPSDICLNSKGTGFYIVSDNGFLYETDLKGSILRRADFNGYDFEAVWCDSNHLVVVDERTRFFHSFSTDSLKLIRTAEVNYAGGRNKGFESLTFNSFRNVRVAFTEKNPVWAFELDADFSVKNRVQIKGFSDVSAATYFKGKLFLLSDEDHAVFRLNPGTYAIEKKFDLPVLNPEGLAFGPEGQLFVLCDDQALLYSFENIDWLK
jgi:uncharacterized protein YjiK